MRGTIFLSGTVCGGVFLRKVLFLTSYPTPYKIEFFDLLGKDMDVTVLYADRREEQTHRSGQWFVEGKGCFRGVQLSKYIRLPRNQHLCPDVISWMKKPWDDIVVGGYSAPTAMLAVAYLRMKKIPFWLEVDGGLIREDSWLAYRIKRLLVGSASGWLSSGKATTDFLVHYGAKREAVREYPFSSLSEKDALEKCATREDKALLRKELGLSCERMILSIGQFIHRKGFDILMKAAADLEPGAVIYIVGGEPTEEYLALEKQLGLTNVRFEGFMKKEKLIKYYRAADLFVLPTREDIWGLVVNEAMAFGLPVITTDRCVAGLELVENGVTGYIVPVEDPDALAEKMNAALSGDCEKMGAAALERVRPYTIENMARVHAEIFGSGPA